MTKNGVKIFQEIKSETGTSSRYVYEIFFLNLATFLFIFRTALPEMKYPFLVIYFISVVYFPINYRNKILHNLIKFGKDFILVLLVFAFLIVSLILSDKIYLPVFKEITNFAVILSLFCFIDLVISERKIFDFYIRNFRDQMIMFGTAISIINLLITFNILISKNSSIIDYNFSLLPIFFGMIAVFFRLFENSSLRKRIVLYVLIWLMSLQVLLSSSRRGLVLYIVIIIILFFTQFPKLAYKAFPVLKIKIGAGRKLLIPIFILSFQPFLIYMMFFQTSSYFMDDFLNFIGVKNPVIAKYNITYNITRYLNIDGNQYFYDLYKRMWRIDYDSVEIKVETPLLCELDKRDPDSGWGIRRHKTIFPLSGKNVEIVPKDAKGYRMDRKCNASTWDGHAFSYTTIFNSSEPGDTVLASVYCYVSEKFDGAWVAIQYEGEYPDIAYYDMAKKGEWQLLEIDVLSRSRFNGVNLYFCKEKVPDFSTLKGYVIFAYPDFKPLHKESTANEQSYGRIHHQLGLSSIFALPPLSFQLNSPDSVDFDPVRRFFAKIISEDTTYTPYKADLSIDTVSNNFLGSRLMRWRFAVKIFTNEYGLVRKLFGGGFNHLNWFGYYFEKDKTVRDYPHNPFLSVLLYGGIFGIVLFILLLVQVIRFYFHYLGTYPYLILYYLLTLYFSFFSAENPFDPPVMGFFVALPFFARHIILRYSKPPDRES